MSVRRRSRRTCSTICASGCPTIRSSTETFITSRRRLRNRRPTVSPSTIWSAIRTLSPLRTAPTARPIIPTVRTSPSDTRTTSSKRSTFRTNCKPSTPRVRCSTPSSAKSCPTGSLRRSWSGRSPKTTSCPTTPSPRPIRSAARTATSKVSTTPARPAELQARSIPVITGYYRPVQNWNDGKRAEFRDRNLYNIDNAINADMSGHGHTRTAKGREHGQSARRRRSPAVHDQDLPELRRRQTDAGGG